jgi:hypothetical protein
MQQDIISTFTKHEDFCEIRFWRHTRMASFGITPNGSFNPLSAQDTVNEL